MRTQKKLVRWRILKAVEMRCPSFVERNQVRSYVGLSEEEFRWHIDYLRETGLIIVSVPSANKDRLLKLTSKGEDYLDRQISLFDRVIAYVVGGGVIGSLIFDVPTGTLMGAVFGIFMAFFLWWRKI